MGRGRGVADLEYARSPRRFTSGFIEAARPSGGYTADCNLSL
jgi:hypothetical protein